MIFDDIERTPKKPGVVETTLLIIFPSPKELETLQHTPASPWIDIQFIKVETTQSSSLIK
jgi:hypothetical protein